MYFKKVQKDKQNPYECSKCGKRFRFPCRLKEHDEVMHSSVIFECHLCHKKFKRKDSYSLHLRCHDINFQWFQCEMCPAKFARQEGLNNHIQLIHHEGLEAKHLCIFCAKGFASVRDYERHINGHTKEKPYFCKAKGCTSEFTCKYSRNSHMEVHKPKEERERPYECNRCTKRFITAGALGLHITSFHLGIKNHECTTCGKRFATRSGLRAHINVHTGETPYPCTVCPKKFKGKGDLKKHLRTHTGERPYACRYCAWAFGRFSVRKNHERVIHGIDPKKNQ